MNTEDTVQELLRDSLHDLADDRAQPLPGLADRVLHTRRRRRTRRAVVAWAAVAVIAVAVVVPFLGTGGGHDDQPARPPKQDMTAHPHRPAPRELIAAGGTAMSAYYTHKTVKLPGKDEIRAEAWYLYDPRAKRYAETRWAWLDVAPGMKTAAVLEGPLPAARIGLLDLATGKVERWIPVDGDGVGSVQWSPDGTKLLATAYRQNPDGRFWDSPVIVNGKKQPGPKDSRTGFYVVDAASGHASFAAVTRADAQPPGSTVKDSHGRTHKVPPAEGGPPVGRDDFAWSHDAKAVWVHLSTNPGHLYFDLAGKRTGVPPAEEFTDGSVPAGLSPDGRLAAGGSAGTADTSASYVLDARTGRKQVVPGEELLAWAGNRRLIAWDVGRGENEFHSRLVLVSLDSKKEVKLSEPLEGGPGADGRWTPIFTRR